ncbi:hypothetical protein [Alloactinosynnema sp. L-07]|uniref:hypothetical protein n=1 Tax=Alloactinosynnema sp. L-07 TaxID=1653480 RepID=UPI0006B46391|nr:hypothetical protein [Alloactinosynnema sp. L-07]
MLPTLRLGFLVAPPSLWSALRKAQFAVDLHPSLPAQATFIERPLLAAHIRRMRRGYHERFYLLRHHDRALARAAKAVGVGVLPLSAFSLGEDVRNGLMLGFGLLKTDQLAEASAGSAR